MSQEINFNSVERNIGTLYFLRQQGFKNNLIVKALFLLNAIPLSSVAKKFGILKAVLYQTTNGYRKNPRVRAAISKTLGIPVRELFDDTQAAKP